MLKLWSTVNEAKEDRPRPFWNAFAACIDAEQKSASTILLDRPMERRDSYLDFLGVEEREENNGPKREAKLGSRKAPRAA